MILSVAIVVIVVLLLRLIVDRARAPRRQPTDAWLPRDLRLARLRYSEEAFSIEQPIRHTARVDRAYELSNGVLVLVEFKNRDRVTAYDSDIVELSAQRVAIQHGTSHCVSDQAFVAIVGSAGRVVDCVRVRLLSEKEVVARHFRVLQLRRGQINAKGCANPRICVHCAYQVQCPKRA